MPLKDDIITVQKWSIALIWVKKLVIKELKNKIKGPYCLEFG